jgi:putative ABC transport system substrate-binding protein
MRVLAALILTAAAALLPAPPAGAQPKPIAIVNFGEHPVLRMVINGFKSELTAQGFAEGRDVVYDDQHVSFNRALIPQMLAQAQGKKPALVLAITTPVAQASIRGITDKSIPVVFGSVVDPVVAKIVPSWERGSETHTGATLLPDFDAALVFVKALLPSLTRLGVPYNPGEDNDTSNMELMRRAAEKHRIQLVTVPVDSAGELPQRIQSLHNRVDAIFLIQSNVLQTSIPVIAATTNRLGIPTINSIGASVQQHQTLAAYAISHEKNGVEAGKLAVRILRGAKPADLPPYRPTAADFTPYISGKQLNDLNLALPESLKNCKCVVE